MKNTNSPSCTGGLLRLGFCLGSVLLALPLTATAQTCIQDEYNLVNKQKLNCTANDVRIAQVTNIRDPLTGQTLTSCFAGQRFNFLADFQIVTTSSQARENIGFYIATSSTTTALTGSCVDNVIQPSHPCPSNSAITCGSNNYHETDPAPDNCGDTSSSDGNGTGIEIVTAEIDNFLCEAPVGSKNVVLPNCTSWQIPGGTIQCVTNPPAYPYPFNGPGGTPTAIPGSPSKCNCSIITLPLTIQTPSINVAKACSTSGSTPNPPDFSNPSAPSPTTCTLTPEGGPVTYYVDMVNDKSNFGSVVIDQVCDTAYGTVFRAASFAGAACPAGSQGSGLITNTTCSAVTIPFNGSSTCTFTVNQPESKSVTNQANVYGHGDSAGSFGPTQSNSVTVNSGEAPTTATVTKGVVGTTAACATVRYSVDVANTSGAGTDETVSVSALNDTAADFGDITSVHGNILGTTCGVAAGAGTLAGTAGAGTLPATLSVGQHYTCQFDGQFCSAIDANSCISHNNSINATTAGDEAADNVTVTANTLTVKECLQTTVTSQ